MNNSIIKYDSKKVHNSKAMGNNREKLKNDLRRLTILVLRNSWCLGLPSTGSRGDILKTKDHAKIQKNA